MRKKDKSTYILGLNFAYHELSACLLKNGKLIAAVEEERFSRVKRGKKALVHNPDIIPEQSILYCLKAAGIKWADIDHIGFSFFPDDRLKNINTDKYFVDGDWGSEAGERLFHRKINRVPKILGKSAHRDLRKKIIWIPHHVCHAASAFLVSPFKESAILTIDGIGELSSTWLGHGNGNTMERIKEIEYPNSVGFLWEKMSKYLGFTEYDSSKVMGLAAYGDASRFYPVFQQIVKLQSEGEFTVDNETMRVRIDDFTQLERLFGVPRIYSPTDIRQDQEDIAAALQRITDDVVLHIAKYLREKTGSENLCLAGGVALNCVSNGRLMQSGLYKSIYVQPAANDAGTAMGAAFHIWNQVLGRKRSFTLTHAYWGPKYSDVEILAALKRAKVKNYQKVRNIADEVAKRLATGGNIIGWFQGRVEWGPRALGNRSLLADPRLADMKMILNERIKKREHFRPFAPSVLIEEADSWFGIAKDCTTISDEFMVVNYDVKEHMREKVPAITHKDGTSRVQLVSKKTNPLYHKLISSFYSKTGVPMVLNTSFNDNEPIVCTPDDAVKTFLRTKMDFLGIGNYLISKN
ncbi:carbamoyl transferase [Candidatus Kaiserbacteria bacterium RIFCSPHIGHO2_01_FULL_54_36]|uniref:Carbamoyl transferase n=1 Tax=Candidatus Kaiserbacteria bacterium RIFCSPHIGHO2_01_FULL_54_36 TaxID=1798482 RepID=A0A1F6CKV0_9BACT|nr:MAG: carbamoyl transferase [Candidatus Kaiserbacteria bacterium RIFCSPHIGHO2_01_FULL_54_36]OGG75480.1 MAG: carbamoyl transferase [Candidatus Kaiserbacteria bacterium RIFCSPLOWO2_01_FULL_54_22]